ncbi:MAG: Si-specific NAD(P)(+) transhydrogenase [Deltaproteobacteria bacterium]|nr:Si-specific NAD(P)(+) transhydrogenase [Deltaproteobacteria bacterium]
MRKFDVIVIGSGPGGERAAIQAAKLDKSVAVIEKAPYIGGAGIHTGTLPSKTLRETALFLAGFKQRAVFGFQFTLGRDVTLGELMHKKSDVIRKQMEVIVDAFIRNNVEIVYGTASFVDPKTIKVKKNDGSTETLSADTVVIASGTRPARPAEIPFDSEHIYDSDTILQIDRIPKTLTIVGGGVIGAEYACIFACLGVKVTLIEKRGDILSFADKEVVESLKFWMRYAGITLRLGEEVGSLRLDDAGRCVTELKSGKVVMSEKVLYTMGRVGNTDALNVAAIGLETNDRGLLAVDMKTFETSVKRVYAVGDVIGFPSLASTSREQGRIAMCHAFEKEGLTCALPYQIPVGVYTIPEISMVGKTEEELTKEGVPYESGIAQFNEVARGQISGDVYGLLKLLFHRQTHKLLGVHIICEKASDLIHIGQAVMSYGGTIDYFKDVVFNYPTMSDAYKLAALNGLNKL